MTVKVPPGGTRGTEFPRVMARVGGGFMTWLFRHGRGHAVGGIPTLILETRGAKSGQRRHAVLGFLAEPDAWLIVASMSGASWNPAWLHNLAHDPDATIELPGGQRIAVRAESLQGQELEAAWRRYESEAGQYANYRSKTDRELAIIRLRRRPAA